MDGATGLKETTLSVNVFTAPGKAMVGERPRPFGEALGFDPITSTLIFGEHDAVLVDATRFSSEFQWIEVRSFVEVVDIFDSLEPQGYFERYR
jgi:hypothetical protein